MFGHLPVQSSQGESKNTTKRDTNLNLKPLCTDPSAVVLRFGLWSLDLGFRIWESHVWFVPEVRGEDLCRHSCDNCGLYCSAWIIQKELRTCKCNRPIQN